MSNIARVFLIPLALTLGLLYVSYPGFMSYDSVRMLEEARTQVMGGIFPAFPVYVLRFFDLTGHGVTAMLTVQNLTVLVSITLLLRMLGVGLKGISISLLVLLTIPTIIGSMLVLWKDITFSALLLLSLALILRGGFCAGREYSVVKWTSLLLIVLATLVRLNGAPATLAILVYWLVVFYGHWAWQKKAQGFIAITACLLLVNSAVNKYRFPTFEKLEPNTLAYGVMAWDLVGTSKWAGVSLTPFASAQSCPQEKLDIQIIDQIYSSLGSEAIKTNSLQFLPAPLSPFPEKYTQMDIVSAWVAALATHPGAYARYRGDLFKEIIGATGHGTFEPTHFNRIDANRFGIQINDRPATDWTLDYIEWTSATFYGKPWFWLALGILSTILVWMNRSIDSRFKSHAYMSLFAAAMYLVPLFFLPLSGEVRYSVPSTLLCFTCILVWCFGRRSLADGSEKPADSGNG